MTDYNTQIREARLALMDAYFGKMKEYVANEDRDGKLVIKKLERIVDSIEYRRAKMMENAPFDPASAKKVREALGMGRPELSKLVGLDHMMIYKYERGVTKVKKEKPDNKKYLEWLKEHGYDPFNLTQST